MRRPACTTALLLAVTVALMTKMAVAAPVAPRVVGVLLRTDEVAACARQARAVSPAAFVHKAFSFDDVTLANGQRVTLASAHTSCLCETASSANCLKVALAQSGSEYRSALEVYATSLKLRTDGTAEASSFASPQASISYTFRWSGAKYEAVQTQTVVNPKDALTRWFNALTCPALDDLVSQGAPYVRSGREDFAVALPSAVEQTLSNSNNVPSYVYDPSAGIALRHFGGDCCHLDTLRFVGKPPKRVPRANLGSARTSSGLRLGSSAASVVAKLGRPRVVKACGLERYQYISDREGEPLDLDFTISRGRVIEIFTNTGG